MSDYEINLKQDWEDLKAEVCQLVRTRSYLTVHEIKEITGATYEDVLWILKTDR